MLWEGTEGEDRGKEKPDQEMFYVQMNWDSAEADGGYWKALRRETWADVPVRKIIQLVWGDPLKPRGPLRVLLSNPEGMEDSLGWHGGHSDTGKGTRVQMKAVRGQNLQHWVNHCTEQVSCCWAWALGPGKRSNLHLPASSKGAPALPDSTSSGIEWHRCLSLSSVLKLWGL